MTDKEFQFHPDEEVIIDALQRPQHEGGSGFSWIRQWFENTGGVGGELPTRHSIGKSGSGLEVLGGDERFLGVIRHGGLRENPLRLWLGLSEGTLLTTLFPTEFVERYFGAYKTIPTAPILHRETGEPRARIKPDSAERVVDEEKGRSSAYSRFLGQSIGQLSGNVDLAELIIKREGYESKFRDPLDIIDQVLIALIKNSQDSETVSYLKNWQEELIAQSQDDPDQLLPLLEQLSLDLVDLAQLSNMTGVSHELMIFSDVLVKLVIVFEQLRLLGIDHGHPHLYNFTIEWIDSEYLEEHLAKGGTINDVPYQADMFVFDHKRVDLRKHKAVVRVIDLDRASIAKEAQPWLQGELSIPTLMQYLESEDPFEQRLAVLYLPISAWNEQVITSFLQLNLELTAELVEQLREKFPTLLSGEQQRIVELFTKFYDKDVATRNKVMRALSVFQTLNFMFRKNRQELSDWRQASEGEKLYFIFASQPDEWNEEFIENMRHESPLLRVALLIQIAGKSFRVKKEVLADPVYDFMIDSTLEFSDVLEIGPNYDAYSELSRIESEVMRGLVDKSYSHFQHLENGMVDNDKHRKVMAALRLRTFSVYDSLHSWVWAREATFGETSDQAINSVINTLENLKDSGLEGIQEMLEASQEVRRNVLERIEADIRRKQEHEERMNAETMAPKQN